MFGGERAAHTAEVSLDQRVQVSGVAAQLFSEGAVYLTEKTFTLEQAGEAQAENAAAHTVGKLVA